MKTIRVMLSVLALVLLSAPLLAAPDCPPHPTPTPPPSAVTLVDASVQGHLFLNVAAFFFGLLIGVVIAALESSRGKR